MRAYAFLAESNSEYDQLTADATAQASFGGYLYQADTSPGQFPAYDEIGFHCRSTGQLVGSLQGFVGDVRTNAANTNYNFYASGNAPNFLQGSTYIGGNTTRNTFELWKSTLTEEQQEQLEVGTLVAPANVATPGDGSFVRQWWYDQQSTEDQALIDSGELDYPERLQAANFTDTFALGDNTNIDLLNDGRAIFRSGVKITGTSNNNESGLTSSLFIGHDVSAQSAFHRFTRGGDYYNYRNYNSTYGAFLINFSLQGHAFKASRVTDPDVTAGNQDPIVSQSTLLVTQGGLGTNTQSFRPCATRSRVEFTDSFVNTQASGTDRVYAFSGDCIARADQINGAADQKGKGGGFVFYQSNASAAEKVNDVVGFNVDTSGETGQTIVGFKSKITAESGIERFNFQAEGNAPNFYAGNTYIGGNTTRNTFELWKSTLTEEQVEQLEAGTLAAPTNVSTPGDGEFARQWYYNLQDESTKADLDSGAIEYPEQFAAATFTDVFVLGSNTKINLNSNGSAKFTGQVDLPGGAGPTQAVTRGEVETMINSLTPGPGVGDITSVNAGDGINGGGSMGDVTLSVDNTVVRTSGNQTIGGNKTFNSSVTVGAGSSSNHALRKSQIETLISDSYPIKSVKDFGAVGDGTTDDTTAVRTALNSGGTIYFPAGLTVLLVLRSILITKALRLLVMVCSRCCCLTLHQMDKTSLGLGSTIAITTTTGGCSLMLS